MTQNKLSTESREACRTAARAIWGAFAFGATPAGLDYWLDVYRTLLNMANNGTYDGNPPRESKVDTKVDKPEMDTQLDPFGQSKWPKRWAMFRDDEEGQWNGPRLLVYARPNPPEPIYRFVDQHGSLWKYCRKATAAEIATVDPDYVEPSAGAEQVQQAMETIRLAMQNDNDWAWTWHCTIAMAAIEAGASPIKANEQAADFMRHAFGVDVRTFAQWRIEMATAAIPQTAKSEKGEDAGTKQRKLTSVEKHWIRIAAGAVDSLMTGCGCSYPWDKRFADLIAVANHGTTDGKPYVEPQPEISEGYRLATEADAQRIDREGWGGPECGWIAAGRGIVMEAIVYRVPVDRIPTDEDAKQRPTVMVRDRDGEKWKPWILLAVVNRNYPFVAIAVNSTVQDSFAQCRFPYPGELEEKA